MQTEHFPMDPQIIASEIDMPVSQWPGNCHAVAESILRLLPVEGMRLARGHYTGHIAKSSVYRGGAGIQQHSWLVAPDGRILDPTRWAMETPDDPKIYLGESDSYDEAGLALRAKSKPYASITQHLSGVAFRKALVEKLSENDRRKLALALGLTEDVVHEAGYARIADELDTAFNAPPHHLDDAVSVYRTLQEVGMKAMIPIDSWVCVMEREKITVTSQHNRVYVLPQKEALSEARFMLRLCDKFLSVETRESLEDDLDTLGYSVENWFSALNSFERHARYTEHDEKIDSAPRRPLGTMVEVMAEFLGNGFGANIDVERFAASHGYDRDQLDDLFKRTGEHAGYSFCWL